MRNLLIKMAVRSRFALTIRNKASLQIRRSLDAYLALSRQIKREQGAEKRRFRYSGFGGRSFADDSKPWQTSEKFAGTSSVLRPIRCSQLALHVRPASVYSLQTGRICDSKNLRRKRRGRRFGADAHRRVACFIIGVWFADRKNSSPDKPGRLTRY